MNRTQRLNRICCRPSLWPRSTEKGIGHAGDAHLSSTAFFGSDAIDVRRTR